MIGSREFCGPGRGLSLQYAHVIRSLNSLKGVIQWVIYGSTRGLIKGHTRSLDYSSYGKGFESRCWGVHNEGFLKASAAIVHV